MCTLVLSRRPGADFPLLLAANRDEMRDRAWDPPARHWPDRPELVAGRDRVAGGTWLGLNDWGVVAAVLNRPGSLGPDARHRSRGELVLEALDHADAAQAAAALAALDPRAYRGFNLAIADTRDAFWIRSDGALLGVHPIPEGISMLTAHDLDDPACPRIRRHLGDFQAAPLPDPAQGDWRAWRDLLTRRAETGPADAMLIETESGFETVSSALIALAAPPTPPVFLFAAGPPDHAPFEPVALTRAGSRRGRA